MRPDRAFRMKPAKSGRPKLTQGPEGRVVLSLMYPTLLGMIATTSYNLADTYFIGQLGPVELAAVSFTFPVVFFIGSVTIGLAHGTAAVCARLFGAENIDDIGRVALHAMLLAVAVGLVFLAIGLLTIDPLFRLLGAQDETLEIIRPYMRIYYYGGVFLVIPLIVNPVLRAAGDARTPAIIVSTFAIVHLVLAPFLIFGWLGAPKLGVEGAAVATVIANAGMTVATLWVVRFREHLMSFTSLSPHLILDSWRRILHVGLPSAAATVITPLTVAFITSQVAQFGHEAVAGYGVASRVESVAALVLMALSVAVTPFVGQNFGARKYARVNAGIRWSERFSLVYGLIVALILGLFGTAIAGAFTDSEMAISTAGLHLRIVPISYMALGVAMTATSSFNAIGRPMPGMIISMTRTILVYAPMAFVLARLFGLTGVFAAACTANFVAGALGYTLIRRVFGGFQPAESN